jgi:hypothetical protein
VPKSQIVYHCYPRLARSDPTDPEKRDLAGQILYSMSSDGISAALRLYRQAPDLPHVFAVLHAAFDFPALSRSRHRP